MEYTCNAAVRIIRLRKTSQIEGNCFPQQGQPVSGQAVSKQQLFINGAWAAGAGSGQARVTAQLKVRLGTGVHNVCLFVGCLTSQQHASVSQGWICSDNFTCCHTEIEAADQMFYLTQSQYTDTRPTSPSADPITPGAW